MSCVLVALAARAAGVARALAWLRRARTRAALGFLQLAALAARHAVSAIYNSREFAVAGGLISYGPSLTGIWRQVSPT